MSKTFNLNDYGDDSRNTIYLGSAEDRLVCSLKRSLTKSEQNVSDFVVKSWLHQSAYRDTGGLTITCGSSDEQWNRLLSWARAWTNNYNDKNGGYKLRVSEYSIINHDVKIQTSEFTLKD